MNTRESKKLKVIHYDRKRSVDRKSKEMEVGGGEGKKYQLSYIFTSLRESSSWRREFSQIISKEYELHQMEDVQSIVKMYQILKEKGYPVPDQVSYRVDEHREIVELIMSDITKGGGFLIWGWSKDMVQQQITELKSMGISEDDFVEIYTLAEELAEKATQDKFLLEYFYIHILKHKLSGKLSLCILDIRGLQMRSTYSYLSKYNKRSVEMFMEELDIHLL